MFLKEQFGWRKAQELSLSHGNKWSCYGPSPSSCFRGTLETVFLVQRHRGSQFSAPSESNNGSDWLGRRQVKPTSGSGFQSRHDWVSRVLLHPNTLLWNKYNITHRPPVEEAYNHPRSCEYNFALGDSKPHGWVSSLRVLTFRSCKWQMISWSFNPTSGCNMMRELHTWVLSCQNKIQQKSLHVNK